MVGVLLLYVYCDLCCVLGLLCVVHVSVFLFLLCVFVVILHVVLIRLIQSCWYLLFFLYLGMLVFS